MGQLYEQIRKNIEKLRQIDEAIKNKQLVSMDEVFETSLSLQKIDYVITYAQQTLNIPPEELGRFPLGQLDNFNLPEDFEEMVNRWEDNLDEQQVSHAIDHLRLQDQAEPYVPEITPHDPKGYYEYVDSTLDKIVSCSLKGYFGISRDGINLKTVSAQQELVKNVFAQDYAFDPHDRGNEAVLDFIDNPLEETVNRHEESLGLNGHNEIKEFLRLQQNYNAQLANQIEHPQAFKDVTGYFPVAKALEPIHKAQWNTKDLSEALEKSVRDYVRDYKGKNDEMNIGSFVSLAKDRIESTLLDHAIALGEDQDSKFLKDFVADPMSTLERRFRDRAATQPDADNSLDGRCASRMHEEVANYNQANAGKVSRFAQIEAGKKRFAEDFFNQHNLNFDPARFKTRFQGSAFERFLGRTSKEWNDLADHIDSWKNENTPRDYDKATDLADKYLRHKFPNVDPKDVTPEMCRGLRGAGKDRGLFALTLVQGKQMAEENANQEIYDAANRRFDQLEMRLHRGANFQDNLASDLENDNEIKNQQNDNEIANDNVIENNNEINM